MHDSKEELWHDSKEELWHDSNDTVSGGVARFSALAGVSGIAADPASPETIYVLTGDGNGFGGSAAFFQTLPDTTLQVFPS